MALQFLPIQTQLPLALLLIQVLQPFLNISKETPILAWMVTQQQSSSMQTMVLTAPHSLLVTALLQQLAMTLLV